MKKEILFTDKAISRINKTNTSFMGEDGKQVDRVRFTFAHKKGTVIQGVFMYFHKTGAKSMYLDYVIDNKSKRYALNNYSSEYNCKAIEDHMFSLREKYGLKDTYKWAQDIRLGEEMLKRDAYASQLQQAQKKTVNDVIQEWYEAGCPKINNTASSLNKNSISSASLHLIGYHLRTKLFSITEDKLCNGVIEFRDNIKDKKYNIKSWQDFWAMFPSEKYNKMEPGISIYDSPFGQQLVSDIGDGDVRTWMQPVQSLGTRRVMKEAFNYIWKFARNKGMFGRKVPADPCLSIKIDRPVTSKFAIYNTKEFTQDEINKIYWGCEELKDKFPFQTQLIQLNMFCGRRKETLLKLKWENVKWGIKEHVHPDTKKKIITYGTVEIPKHVNKTKKADQFVITKNIKDILDSLAATREVHHWARFIDWIFPSPRVKDKHFLRKGNENNTDKARLKDVRALWVAIKERKGLKDVAMKMFRNTFDNKVNENNLAVSSWDAIEVTGHAETRTYEKSYLNKKITDKTRSIADDIDSNFDKIIRLKK